MRVRTSHIVVQPNGSPEGQRTLNDFVNHQGGRCRHNTITFIQPSFQPDVPLSISGFNGSTDITSLAQAMESVNVNVTLPASKFDLLGTASLTGKVIIFFSQTGCSSFVSASNNWKKQHELCASHSE